MDGGSQVRTTRKGAHHLHENLQPRASAQSGRVSTSFRVDDARAKHLLLSASDVDRRDATWRFLSISAAMTRVVREIPPAAAADLGFTSIVARKEEGAKEA